MSGSTTNYGLTKPTQDEFYNVDVQNGNMNIIDEKLKEHATSLSDLTKQVNAQGATDANTLLTTGRYLTNGCANIPFTQAGTYALIDVISDNSKLYVNQTLTYVHGYTVFIGKTYTRYYDNGIWSDWIAFSANATITLTNGWVLHSGTINSNKIGKRVFVSLSLSGGDLTNGVMIGKLATGFAPKVIQQKTIQSVNNTSVTNVKLTINPDGNMYVYKFNMGDIIGNSQVDVYINFEV